MERHDACVLKIYILSIQQKPYAFTHNQFQLQETSVIESTAYIFILDYNPDCTKRHQTLDVVFCDDLDSALRATRTPHAKQINNKQEFQSVRPPGAKVQIACRAAEHSRWCSLDRLKSLF